MKFERDEKTVMENSIGEIEGRLKWGQGYWEIHIVLAFAFFER